MKKRKYLLLLFFICFMGCNKKYEVKEYKITTVKFTPSVASFWGKSAPYYQYIAISNDGEVISKKTSKFVEEGMIVITTGKYDITYRKEIQRGKEEGGWRILRVE